MTGEEPNLIPVDYNDIFPELNGYLLKPLLVNPPMCTLNQLQDGTYLIKDVEIMHQIIEMKAHMNPIAAPAQPMGGLFQE